MLFLQGSGQLLRRWCYEEVKDKKAQELGKAMEKPCSAARRVGGAETGSVGQWLGNEKHIFGTVQLKRRKENHGKNESETYV